MVLWFASCGVVYVLVVLCSLFCFFVFIPLHKTPKNRTQQKPPKKKKQKCREKGQTKKSVSAVVFTNSVPNFWGWVTKMLCFAENLQNRGFSIF